MRVVQLMASPFIGGPERQVLGLAESLPAECRTTFLSFPEQGLARPFLAECRLTPRPGKCRPKIVDLRGNRLP